MMSNAFFREGLSRSTTLPTTRELLDTIRQQERKIQEQETAQKKALQQIKQQASDVREIKFQQTETVKQLRHEIEKQTSKNEELTRKLDDITNNLSGKKNMAVKKRLPANISVS